jgi:hypothetical protein
VGTALVGTMGGTAVETGIMVFDETLVLEIAGGDMKVEGGETERGDGRQVVGDAAGLEATALKTST